MAKFWILWEDTVWATSMVEANDEDEARELAEQGHGTRRVSISDPPPEDWRIRAVKAEKEKDWK